MKKVNKITWLSADYFIDCDIPIIKSLKKQYEIEWHIILPQNGRFSKDQIDEFEELKDIKKIFWSNNFRYRNIRNVFLYTKILKQIKNNNYDIIYINIQGFPYFAFISAIFLDRNKTIFAVHQAMVHEGMNYKLITSLYFSFLYNWFIHFHLFSKTQAKIFKQNYLNKKIYVIPLALKDYGLSIKKISDNQVIFLNFGTIIKNKNIKILIRAACNIYDKGIKNFKIKIYGSCTNWSEYQKLIKYPEIFDIEIRHLKNEEIADLFCSSHYLILPYSSVSQSGPLKIAFNYNIPVISSDLEEFRNEITDKKTGYIFKNNDIESLENVLINAILSHEECYEDIKRMQKIDVQERYSEKAIIDSYKKMFQSIEK